MRGEQLNELMQQFYEEQVRELEHDDIIFDTEGNPMRFHSSSAASSSVE